MLVVAVIALVWLVIAVMTLVRVMGKSDDAEATLDQLRAELDVDALLDGRAEAGLRSLRAQLADIDAGVTSPVLAPLRLVPGMDRQVASARALSSAGIEVVDVGLGVLGELGSISDRPFPTGPARLDLIDEVTGLLVEGRADLDGVDLGPRGPLLGALAGAHETAREGLDELSDLFREAEAAGSSLRTLLAGGEHLLLAANSAEMRSGSGMFLRAGLLRTAEGGFVVEGLRPTEELRLDPGAVAPGTPTYDELWGYLHPTVEWRNLGASPRFDVTAELAARMWEASTGTRLDGVIAVDPHALAAIVEATGPVDVAGRRLAADEVVAYALHDQYDVFADLSPEEAHAARREEVGTLADTVLRALTERAVDPIELAVALRDAVRGRHVLLWSADPAVQQDWEQVGAAGVLASDSMMVSVLNRGANKLDPFLVGSAQLRFDDRVRGGFRSASVDITLENTVPAGEVPYVAGPDPRVEATDSYGDYAGVLAIALPGSARRARIEGVDALEVAGQDGPVLALATRFVLEAGAERRFRITFDVPLALSSVRLEPSARPVPLQWRAPGFVGTDGEAHRVDITTVSG